MELTPFLFLGYEIIQQKFTDQSVFLNLCKFTNQIIGVR